MEVTLTEQLKLLTDPVADQEFRNVTERYAMAATEVSQIYFESGMKLSMKDLQEMTYYPIRMAYGLKSQMAQSVVKTVLARYKAVDEQMRTTFATYKDDVNDVYYSFKRNKYWLQRPIEFRRPQADLVRGRDWSFRSGMTEVSVNTLENRMVCAFQCREGCRIFDPEWKQGGAKLVFHESDKHWYLHVSVTKTFEDVSDKDIKHVCGHDRGLINLTTTCHADDTVTYINGEHVGTVRDRYARTRASLQENGTKGAKRVLKKISGRENRMVSDVNHCISRTLAMEGTETLHTLEDLTGISFSEKNLQSRDADVRRKLRSWPFYDQEKKLEYKAVMQNSKTLDVDPKYTSQRCPNCGNIDKNARDRSRHLYTCPKCGRMYNDDEAGSRNIKALGVWYMDGIDEPHFVKN